MILSERSIGDENDPMYPKGIVFSRRKAPTSDNKDMIFAELLYEGVYAFSDEYRNAFANDTQDEKIKITQDDIDALGTYLLKQRDFLTSDDAESSARIEPQVSPDGKGFELTVKSDGEEQLSRHSLEIVMGKQEAGLLRLLITLTTTNPSQLPRPIKGSGLAKGPCPI